MIFHGKRNNKKNTVSVTVDNKPLPTYLKYCNHSPDGFNWGYGGSGPSQLAFAILYHYTKDRDLVWRLHHNFKNEYVAGWEDEWQITSAEIQAFINNQKDLAKKVNSWT